MKTFLNVLYRRILYKIPLKLLLVLLAVFGLLFACTKADNISITAGMEGVGRGSTNTKTLSSGQVLCVQCTVENWNFYTNLDSTPFSCGTTNKSICFYNVSTVYIYHGRTSTTNLYYSYLSSTDFSDMGYINSSSCPNQYTSQECQSEYDLIPINEVDSSYCQSNNLCPSGGTPSDCPNIGVSNLFINDIFHPGAFNIIMNIPEEISRDYAYTNSGNNFNLDIEGYNVDYEKMQSVIDNQSYIPTEEDFQNIIAILTPYTKIIVFFVFLFIVWAWIKKPFKSKKL